MDDPTWAAVDAYIADRVLPDDDALAAAVSAAEAAGLPPINVSPAQGMFLHVLARSLGAARVLELGTLAGYSGICLARALGPGGRLVTCELDVRHATVARENFAHAGVAESVDLRVGAAADTLEAMIGAGEPPFDLVFIDADKDNYPRYLDLVLRLSRPGTVVVADNVVRGGDVLSDSQEPTVAGIRRFTERLGELQRAGRVVATEIQTVGTKGYDGFAFCLVTG